MPIRDRLAAAAMVIIWGLNFVVMKFCLQDMPPLLLGTMRFVFVAFPAVLFVRRPTVPLHLLVAYGLTIGFGQFALVFSAIYVGMPTGLASLVLQTQVFITLLLSALAFGDRLRLSNFLGLALAFAGLSLLMFASVSGRGVSIPGFILTLCAAASWACGNIVTKKIGKVDVLGLVAWGAVVSVVPFALTSLLLEGWPQITQSLTHLSMTSVLGVAYLSFGASLVGYTIWGHLLGTHPVWKVAPLTLLVPIVGLLAGWMILGEALSPLQMIGCVTVLGGLVVNIFGAQASGVLRRLGRN